MTRLPACCLRAVPLALLASCVAPDGPSEPSAPSFAISDAVHSGGNSHFFWLPPMVGQPASFNGDFDATQSPTVTIRDLAGPQIAQYSMTTGPGSETVRLSVDDQHYLVNWHTSDFPVTAGPTYRIEVRVSGTLLGFADVQLGGTGKDAKNLTTSETIGLVDGRTLPIRFRIEEGAVFVVSPEAGGTVEALGGTVMLEIPPGALTEETGITVEVVEPTGSALAVVEFGPSGLQFAEPVPITIAYDAAALPPGLSEADLALNLKDPSGRWIILPGSTVDVVNKTVTAPFHHFSEGGVGPAELALFCSGDSNPDTFDTIEESLGAVISQGTVEVCGGTHSVEGVLLDRPVTIRSAAGATPVLQTQTAAQTFEVHGYTAGSVILDGLTFNFTTPTPPAPAPFLPYAVRTRMDGGTWDQLIIRNTTFLIGPTSRGALQPNASSVAGAHLVLDNVTINGGLFAVATLGVSILVQNSSFTDCRQQCLLIQAGSTGTVLNTTFDNCGSVFCLNVNSGSTAEVRGSSFTSPDPVLGQPDDLDVVVQVTNSSIVLEDNDFTSCGKANCLFARGTDVQATVVGNRFLMPPGTGTASGPDAAVLVFVGSASTVTAALVENNTFTRCWVDCIVAGQKVAATIRHNTVTIPAGSPPIRVAVVGGGGANLTPGAVLDPALGPVLTIEDNTVEGLEAIADRQDSTAYPIRAGVRLTNATVTSLARNVIRGAAMGVAAYEASNVVEGRDNVVETSLIAVKTSNYQPSDTNPGRDDGRVTLRFNDFLDYIHAIMARPGDTASDVTCNFWGAPSGEPLGVFNAGTSTSIFTPWAAAPIAGTGASSCP